MFMRHLVASNIYHSLKAMLNLSNEWKQTNPPDSLGRQIEDIGVGAEGLMESWSEFGQLYFTNIENVPQYFLTHCQAISKSFEAVESEWASSTPDSSKIRTNLMNALEEVNEAMKLPTQMAIFPDQRWSELVSATGKYIGQIMGFVGEEQEKMQELSGVLKEIQMLLWFRKFALINPPGSAKIAMIVLEADPEDAPLISLVSTLFGGMVDMMAPEFIKLVFEERRLKANLNSYGTFKGPLTSLLAHLDAEMQRIQKISALSNKLSLISDMQEQIQNFQMDLLSVAKGRIEEPLAEKMLMKKLSNELSEITIGLEKRNLDNVTVANAALNVKMDQKAVREALDKAKNVKIREWWDQLGKSS